MNSITEVLTGIVHRITYHNQDNGWSVLRVIPFNSMDKQETVTVHQTKVYAGATMEFHGAWTQHPQYGRQFKANNAIEKKPASAAALEKYLGSGLIKGVGPKIAKKIVSHFGDTTLDIFEKEIDKLTQVPGIANKKLTAIERAWTEHKAIRDVMIFLQGHGISTLFAVRIFKEYDNNAIQIVTDNPYRLANDFFGIGFFSADKVALSIGLDKDSRQRITAAIRHILAASREQGHCYLTLEQIQEDVNELLKMDISERIPEYLTLMQEENLLKVRIIEEKLCYYSKSLYFDEKAVADKLNTKAEITVVDNDRVQRWIEKYCDKKRIQLSDEQKDAAKGVVAHNFSVLTGGPGCGKTTATLVIVRLLEAMNRKVLLAAPTGRAAQRMTEVIGREAKTIHRLLKWKLGKFQHNEDEPFNADFLIVDECSMLDITLAAALLKAVPRGCQVLFIGDPDQLPSVGAGNVLKDIIAADKIPCFTLTKVFRQAAQSLIIKYAHLINKGQNPFIQSPFNKPEIWKNNHDCIFIDSEEATKEQVAFVRRVKKAFKQLNEMPDNSDNSFETVRFGTGEMDIKSAYEKEFVIPDKFKHVQFDKIIKSESQVEELKAVINKIHPWSSLHYGLAAIDVVVKLYTQWIPKYIGRENEIQILSPMTRGTLGTNNLNKVIQNAVNPLRDGTQSIKVGEKIFREGDRVIHRKNNYDLEVFNGDIGIMKNIDNENMTCAVEFFPDRRLVQYRKEDIVELDLAYAITIHKSQGSEFSTVIIPVLTQHFKMLYRNLIYTGLTRAKKMTVFVGTRKALAMAVQQKDTSKRQTALETLIVGSQ